MKKILIFTVTAGNGHNAIAQTVKDSLLHHYPDEVEVQIINFFIDYPGKFKGWIVNDGYKMSVKHALPIYNAIFKKRQVTKPIKHNPTFINYLIHGRIEKMQQTIAEFQPDAIFCTHFLPAAALSLLRKNGKLNIPVATMETDFVYTPYLECCTGVDKIYMPAEEYVEHFLKVGYTREQIEVLGFPSKINVEHTTRDKNKRLTILIMSGAGAFKGLPSQIRHLLKADFDIKLILLNGKDEKHRKSYQRIADKLAKSKKLKNTTIEVYGFVSNEKQLELLKEADCLVSKAGGNSTIEAINLSKVLITTTKLAEQELSNVRYLQKYSECFLLDKPTDLRDLVAKNTFTHEFFEKFIKNIRVLHRENTNKSYADALMNLKIEEK